MGSRLKFRRIGITGKSRSIRPFLLGPGACFSKAPETFRARKAISESRTLRLQSCFIHTFLIRTEVPFIQEVSDVNTSPFLDTDELKMALRARKVFGAFEKRAPGDYAHNGKVVITLLISYFRSLIDWFP